MIQVDAKSSIATSASRRLFCVIVTACLVFTSGASRSMANWVESDESVIDADTLDALLAASMKALPLTADIEVFRTHERPPKPRDVIEAETRQRIAERRIRSRGQSSDYWDAAFIREVRSLEAWYDAPILDRQRFQYSAQSRRLDSATNRPGETITPIAPYEDTCILPGNPETGDGRFYEYHHWHANESTRINYAKFGPGSASRSDFNRTQWIPDIREELLGIERLLLEILAVEVCELPKPPLTKAPQARDLPLDRQKIENLLADKGNIRLRVSEFEADGERRLRIRFLSPKGWGIVAPKELTPFAEIVVKADDFRAVYEQRLLDDKGSSSRPTASMPTGSRVRRSGCGAAPTGSTRRRPTRSSTRR